MIAICDASPLIALGQVAKLDILKELFDQVFIPRAVYSETVTGCRVEVQRNNIITAIDNFIEIREPAHDRIFQRSLGAGERGVIDLALELETDIVLIDDKKARNEAKALGLLPFFTTDILHYAEREGLISSYEQILKQLDTHRIYLPRQG